MQLTTTSEYLVEKLHYMNLKSQKTRWSWDTAESAQSLSDLFNGEQSLEESGQFSLLPSSILPNSWSNYACPIVIGIPLKLASAKGADIWKVVQTLYENESIEIDGVKVPLMPQDGKIKGDLFQTLTERKEERILPYINKSLSTDFSSLLSFNDYIKKNFWKRVNEKVLNPLTDADNLKSVVLSWTDEGYSYCPGSFCFGHENETRKFKYKGDIYIQNATELFPDLDYATENGFVLQPRNALNFLYRMRSPTKSLKLPKCVITVSYAETNFDLFYDHKKELLLVYDTMQNKSSTLDRRVSPDSPIVRYAKQVVSIV